MNPEGNSYRLSDTNTVCGGCRLVIVSANYSHAGVYTCRALNRVNTIDSNITVVVGGKLMY